MSIAQIALLFLLPLVLMGYARASAFVINHAIFGHRDDIPLMKWTAIILPFLLLGLSVLFIPLFREASESDLSGVAMAGAIWFFGSAVIGLIWIGERFVELAQFRPAEGVNRSRSEIVRLRKAHIPYAGLQRLGLHNEVYDLEINRYDVHVPHLPPEFDGYRIGFLTDLHVASFMRRGLYRTAVEALRADDVDLVLLGGDFVSWERHIPLMATTLMENLEARDGVWAVLGNHDYWAGAEGIVAALTSRGVRFIVNRSVEIRRGDSAIRLVGIDEIYRGTPDPEAAFRDVPEETVVIGISHHPDIIDLLEDRCIDLLVCGHTHGGQIRFPFFGALIVPSAHEWKYAAGFFREKSVLMYVSRGLGAIPPVRILCRPEVAIFTLRQ